MKRTKRFRTGMRPLARTLTLLTLWVSLLVLPVVPAPARAPGSALNNSTRAATVAPHISAASGHAEGPTEVLVILRGQAQLPALHAHGDKTTRGRIITGLLRQHAVRTQAPLRAWLDAQGVSYRAFYIVNALLVEADGPLLDEIAARPEIAAITTNPAVAAPLAVQELERADPERLLVPAEVPWGVARIGAPAVWAWGYHGEGIVVAGQDTGYEWDHPALKARYRGWNGAEVDHDYNWHDAIRQAGGNCLPDSPVPCDDHGHGTHTMGTIVGQSPGAAPIGVAPGAQWIGCRNMHLGIGTPATYAECFEFFLAPYPVGGTPLQGDPGRAPDVINNSWSCPPSEGCDPFHIAFLEQVVDTVRAAGIMVIASAGNSGPSCDTVIHPPAIYAASTTIGATDSDDMLASFSSRGLAPGPQKPDLSAPGVGVYSSQLNGHYGYSSGTSMAAPHVTGAAALLWSARPDLRGQVGTTEWLLKITAAPRTSSQCGDAPNAVPNQVFGWGRLDALAAVQAGLEGLPTRMYFPFLIREVDKVHSIP
jgi:serine protease AprX